MSPKIERLELRLDSDLVERVDAWRDKRASFPTRAEALRHLLTVGLDYADTAAVLSPGEKLITMLLCQVIQRQKIDVEYDTKLIQEAITGGHLWALEMEYQGTFPQHLDQRWQVREVWDILDMWQFVEEAYPKLSAADKARVAKEAEPWGNKPRFRGFDGNNESTHYSIARFTIDTMKRFTFFAGRDLNSHMHTLDGARQMYAAFEPIRKTLVGRGLNAEEIILLLNAQRRSSD